MSYTHALVIWPLFCFCVTLYKGHELASVALLASAIYVSSKHLNWMRTHFLTSQISQPCLFLAPGRELEAGGKSKHTQRPWGGSLLGVCEEQQEGQCSHNRVSKGASKRWARGVLGGTPGSLKAFRRASASHREVLGAVAEFGSEGQHDMMNVSITSIW